MPEDLRQTQARLLEESASGITERQASRVFLWGTLAVVAAYTIVSLARGDLAAGGVFALIGVAMSIYSLRVTRRR
jgi:hypothetical protein